MKVKIKGTLSCDFSFETETEYCFKQNHTNNIEDILQIIMKEIYTDKPTISNLKNAIGADELRITDCKLETE